jgi:hypothetical protein
VKSVAKAINMGMVVRQNATGRAVKNICMKDRRKTDFQGWCCAMCLMHPTICKVLLTQKREFILQ